MSDNNHLCIEKDNYAEYGNNYRWWIDKAENLLISSNILERAYLDAEEKMKTEKTGKVPVEYWCCSSMYFLKAMAMESYLKAVYLKKGGKLCDNNHYIGNKKHNLLNWAKETELEKELKEDEKTLLEDLSFVINYWGRYAIPLSSEDFRKKVKGIIGIQPLYKCNPVKDLSIFEGIISKIILLL